MAPIVTLALRGFQIIFAVIVLGLSVSLAKGQQQGKAPSQTDYAAFCGGAGLIIAFVGLAAVFVEFLQGIIMTALDGLATLFTLAGGIALAVALKVHSCNDVNFLETNNIIRGATAKGTIDFGGDLFGDFLFFGSKSHLQARCHDAQADTAFLFFMFAAFAATLVLGLMGKGGRNGSMV